MNNTDEVSTPPFPPPPPPPSLYDRPQENSHQINQINHSDFLILAFARFLLLSYNIYLCSGWVLITLALVFRHSVQICSITFAHKTPSRVKTMKSYHHNQFLRSPENYKLLNKHIQSLDLCERCQKEIENDKHYFGTFCLLIKTNLRDIQASHNVVSSVNWKEEKNH